MWNRLSRFADKHPWWALFTILSVISTVAFCIIAILEKCGALTTTLEDVKDAQYVRYTSEGEMKAVEYSTIVDMETGYQYCIFKIDGQYVCAPAIDEDGTVYKTVE